jgi:hypothetical protein
VIVGQNEISLQQLSATFRRGDLIEKLSNMDITTDSGNNLKLPWVKSQ